MKISHFCTNFLVYIFHLMNEAKDLTKHTWYLTEGEENERISITLNVSWNSEKNIMNTEEPDQHSNITNNMTSLQHLLQTNTYHGDCWETFSNTKGAAGKSDISFFTCLGDGVKWLDHQNQLHHVKPCLDLVSSDQTIILKGTFSEKDHTSPKDHHPHSAAWGR